MGKRERKRVIKRWLVDGRIYRISDDALLGALSVASTSKETSFMNRLTGFKITIEELNG